MIFISTHTSTLGQFSSVSVTRKGWDGGRRKEDKNAYQTTLMCSCALEVGGGERGAERRGEERAAGGAG